jgi:hypothetical protein
MEWNVCQSQISISMTVDKFQPGHFWLCWRHAKKREGHAAVLDRGLCRISGHVKELAKVQSRRRREDGENRLHAVDSRDVLVDPEKPSLPPRIYSIRAHRPGICLAGR